MAKSNKEEVFNTITLFNTIGQEIEEILDANKIDNSTFLKYLGWEEKNLQSITRISNPNLIKIETLLKIEGLKDYLYAFQEKYQENVVKSIESFRRNKKIFQPLKPVVPLLKDDFVDGIDLLEDVADFFGVEDESTIFELAEINVARYRSANFIPDTINLFAWLRRGQIDFAKIELHDYNKNALLNWVETREWIDHIEDRRYFNFMPKKFKEFGVGLVFTSYLPKTVYGAIRWIDHKPLIQISDREKSLATCWYTLFHEIGHAILHENDDICEGNINESKRKSNRKEIEANSFAAKHLFGGDNMRKLVFDYANQIVDDSLIEIISERYNTNKMFVAYWMKKARVNNRKYTSYIPEICFD